MRPSDEYPEYLSYCSWRNTAWTEHPGVPYRALINWRGQNPDGWGRLKVWKVGETGQMVLQDNDKMWEEYIASRSS